MVLLCRARHKQFALHIKESQCCCIDYQDRSLHPEASKRSGRISPWPFAETPHHLEAGSTYHQRLEPTIQFDSRPRKDASDAPQTPMVLGLKRNRCLAASSPSTPNYIRLDKTLWSHFPAFFGHSESPRSIEWLDMPTARS
jgi:hypothetical protein